MSTIQKVELDTTQRCPDAIEFEARLRDRVVGQDEAIEKLSWLVQTFMAGFSPVGRLAGVLLFLGPTGIPHSKPRYNLVPTSPRPLAPSPFHCHRKNRIGTEAAGGQGGSKDLAGQDSAA
jgi:hypothetical protein